MKTIIIALVLILTSSYAHAWSCASHLIVAVKSGNVGVEACKPDNKPRSFKHWKNTPKGIVITKANFTSLPYDGELYERISMLYAKPSLTTTELEELIHAAGDITQPLHNAAYDDYNKAMHKAIDGMDVSYHCIVDLPVPTDPIAYAAQLANEAHATAYTREYSQAQACTAISKSIALAKALTKKGGE